MIRHARIALLVSALVLTGGAASAAQETAKDRTGETAPAADITRVVVKNGVKTLSVKAKLMKASAGRTHLVITLTPAAGGATYVVRTAGTGQGEKVAATLESTALDATEPATLDCVIKAAVSSGRRGQVSVRVPQACFGADAGTLVASVATETPAGEVADETPVLRVTRG